MNIFALALAAILGVSTLIGGGYWWGDDAATNRYEARAAVAQQAAAKRLAADNRRVQSAEHESARGMTSVSTIYQKGSSDVIEYQKSVIAGVRSGAVRLSIATRSAPASAADTTPAGPSRCDGEARRPLSDAAAEFLTGLASEADAVALQLSACQALLLIDRATVNQDQGESDR